MLQAKGLTKIHKNNDRSNKTLTMPPPSFQQSKGCNQNIFTVEKEKKEEFKSIIQPKPNKIDSSIHNQSNQTRVWRIIFACASLIQFAVLIGEITIQYITSKIIIEVFFILIMLVVITQISLLVLFYKSQVPLNNRANGNSLEHNRENQHNFHFVEGQNTKLQLNRSQAKTKKLKYPQKYTKNTPNNQQTVKRLEATKSNESSLRHQKLMNHQQISMNMQLTIFTQIINVVLGIAVTTAFLVKSQNYQIIKAIIILPIASYILIVGTSLVLIKINQINKMYYMKVANGHKQQKIGKSVQNEPIASEKLGTVVSIEQQIQRSITSIQKPIYQKQSECQNIVINESISHNQTEYNKNITQKSQNVSKNIHLEEFNKCDIKKSVLKNQKVPKNVKKASTTTHQLQKNGLRKKVEIDSNKIQYFQYSQKSQSQSINSDANYKNENYSNKIIEISKRKVNLPKLMLLMQKMQMQNKILKRKKQNRQNRAKTFAQSRMNQQLQMSYHADIIL